MDTLMYSSPSGNLSPKSWVDFRTYKKNVSNLAELADRLIKRLASDSFWRGELKGGSVFTAHVRQSRKLAALGWATLLDEWPNLFVNEPSGSFKLHGGPIERRFTVRSEFNTIGDAALKNVDGKRRMAPISNDRSCFSISIPAYESDNLPIRESFLSLGCDFFELIDSPYSFAEHGTIKATNGYDSGHRDFFNPEFVTWANWFGREWVEAKGRAYVMAAPAHEIRELSNGAVMMTICASPMEQMGMTAQRAGYELKRYLGIVSPSERDGEPPFAPQHPADW